MTNEIINKKSKSKNIDYIKDCDQEISNNREIANIMNDFFCTVAIPTYMHRRYIIIYNEFSVSSIFYARPVPVNIK